MPRVSAASVVSMTWTGMPALAKHMAMPPPIVPAPMTAARTIGRTGVSSGTSGIFATCRSAKKEWIAPLLCGEGTSSMKICRSRARASSNGVVRVISIASTARCGATCPRARRARSLRIAAMESGLARAAASFSSRLRTFGCGPAPSERREGDGARREVAVDDRIDHAQALGLRRRHRIAGQDHLDRRLDAGKAR